MAPLGARLAAVTPLGAGALSRARGPDPLLSSVEPGRPCGSSSASAGARLLPGRENGDDGLRGAAAAAASLCGALLYRRVDRRSRVARRAKPYRMPLPADVDEIKAPRWNVLMDAVKNCEAEDAVVPTWKLKPQLGIYSPTPQYKPLHYIEKKPFWQKSTFVKRKMKKFYSDLRDKRMEAEGYRLRFLPDPKDRLHLAGIELRTGDGTVFKEEEKVWKKLRGLSVEDLEKLMNDQRGMRLGMAGKRIPLNWRPGFQTVAIKELKTYIKRIDVVVEVRDARIPWVTAHPDIPDWVRPKPRVIVLTKADLVPKTALEETIMHIKASERDRGVPVVAVDAQRGGQGIEDLRLELVQAGAYVNRRRKRKGVNPRAIRTIMLGFPNVGKSSIINRLANRKVAARTNWAGVTRRMTWHKIGGFRNTELEFLDCPGTIPVCFGKRYTEEQGLLLCMCRIFGEKHIDREKTAYELVAWIGKLASENPHMLEKTVWKETLRIYGVDFKKALKHEAPFLPDSVPTRNPEPYCGKLLNDFNRGYWGRIQLEPPPDVVERRQDYSHAMGAGGAAGKAGQTLGGQRVRGALPAPGPLVPMPGKDGQPQREKVPVAAEGGLFDGW